MKNNYKRRLKERRYRLGWHIRRYILDYVLSHGPEPYFEETNIERVTDIVNDWYRVMEPDNPPLDDESVMDFLADYQSKLASHRRDRHHN